MPRIELTVDLIEYDADGAIVCGCCCEEAFGLGDVFTRLHWRRGVWTPEWWAEFAWLAKDWE
jgi:hypothetical protein